MIPAVKLQDMIEKHIIRLRHWHLCVDEHLVML